MAAALADPSRSRCRLRHLDLCFGSPPLPCCTVASSVSVFPCLISARCFHSTDPARSPRTRLWHPLFLFDHGEVRLLILRALD
ncbi:hypothetical protein OPV22_000081 [Ensete ventricosum]|uniref:Uncharacterized protein n=1 Tax=Ensete ventricosum TaxID=4639 RepID=A0AAV8RUZ7_ENSVE|nr:hypothetical protein OPV22_000081 [Ensete ventricosum]